MKSLSSGARYKYWVVIIAYRSTSIKKIQAQTGTERTFTERSLSLSEGSSLKNSTAKASDMSGPHAQSSMFVLMTSVMK